MGSAFATSRLSHLPANRPFEPDESVAAGALEDADAAFNRGDCVRTLRVARPLADRGNAKVPALLGTMYENREGVAQNLTEAVKWLRKAAEGGEVTA
jgi:uncharacterized protein